MKSGIIAEVNDSGIIRPQLELVEAVEERFQFDKTLRLLKSGQHFFMLIHAYVHELRQIRFQELASEILQWVIDLFRIYFISLSNKSEQTGIYLDINNCLGVLATMYNIYKLLFIPLMESVTSSQTNLQRGDSDMKKTLNERDEQQQQQQSQASSKQSKPVAPAPFIRNRMENRFTLTFALFILKNVLQIETIRDYDKKSPNSQSQPSQSQLSIQQQQLQQEQIQSQVIELHASEQFVSLVFQIAEFARAVKQNFMASDIQKQEELVCKCIMNVVHRLSKINVKNMNDKEGIKKSPLELCGLGAEGVHQLFVDIYFLQFATKTYSNDIIKIYFEKIVSRVKELFSDQNPQLGQMEWDIYKEWYENQAQISMLNAINMHSSLDSILYK
ncbi:MAG: hypothetical protein EZS28_017384 [Streblomastix strix]|uniref:Uncharacterized protein n=1 Tax=Streblomastix strix TaxID=222440 RepID=A0A5J4VWS0_9EUKA|nr:MAG: hypothetical protein EZS28_017384 [Streblomastix strix]